MYDQIDRANELAEKEREFMLVKHKQKTIAFSLTRCEDCDEPIPENRRKQVQGCTRCVECQTIFENKQKHYRR